MSETLAMYSQWSNGEVYYPVIAVLSALVITVLMILLFALED